jgi:hypothetical protein
MGFGFQKYRRKPEGWQAKKLEPDTGRRFGQIFVYETTGI